MKRCYFGAGLLAVLLAVSILLAGILERQHTKIAGELQQAAQAMREEDWPRARDLVADAAETWADSAHFFASMLDHEPMEEIGSLLAQLKNCLAIENGEDALQLCADTARRLEGIAKNQRCNWWNIL